MVGKISKARKDKNGTFKRKIKRQKRKSLSPIKCSDCFFNHVIIVNKR